MPPSVPDDVELTEGTFTNAQGMQLATFSWCLKPRGLLGTAPRPKGIVLLLHGYGSHTFFEWMHAPAPGEPHTKFTGTVIEGCVRDGWAVHAIDHQGHGQSEGARAYFERFTHLADEASAYVDMLLSGDRWRGLPVFLWSVSMGGATALTMARRDPDKYAGLVLYAPMISLEQVQNQEVLPGKEQAPQIFGSSSLCNLTNGAHRQSSEEYRASQGARGVRQRSSVLARQREKSAVEGVPGRI